MKSAICAGSLMSKTGNDVSWNLQLVAGDRDDGWIVRKQKRFAQTGAMQLDLGKGELFESFYQDQIQMRVIETFQEFRELRFRRCVATPKPMPNVGWKRSRFGWRRPS